MCASRRNWLDALAEEPEKDPNTALFRIEVIKVPLAAPQDAKVVSNPRVFMDARTGAMNGLNNGGTHGKKGPEKPKDTEPMPRHYCVFGDWAWRRVRAPETEFCSILKTR